MISSEYESYFCINICVTFVTIKILHVKIGWIVIVGVTFRINLKFNSVFIQKLLFIANLFFFNHAFNVFFSALFVNFTLDFFRTILLYRSSFSSLLNLVCLIFGEATWPFSSKLTEQFLEHESFWLYQTLLLNFIMLLCLIISHCKFSKSSWKPSNFLRIWQFSVKKNLLLIHHLLVI